MALIDEGIGYSLYAMSYVATALEGDRRNFANDETEGDCFLDTVSERFAY